MSEQGVRPLRWVGDESQGFLEMLDQRQLPGEEVWLAMRSYQQVADGIRDMVIRGAPAIGIAAAFGVALAARAYTAERAGGADDFAEFRAAMQPVHEHLAATRPTAVNLFWALERMQATLAGSEPLQPGARVARLFEEARAISAEDLANNRRMGELGAALLPDGARILTHCNTGALATGGLGTALGIIRAAHATGKLAHVWVDETRPYLQGARLTAWELHQEHIPCTLICDNMAAYYMQQGQVDAVIVGTDRVAANGDMANKIGSYGLAVLCAYHNIPFYVAAPLSTIDYECPSGAQIPIEQRAPHEVTHLAGRAIAPQGMAAANPAFDVTPHALISGIITEEGVVRAPYFEGLAELRRR